MSVERAKGRKDDQSAPRPAPAPARKAPRTDAASSIEGKSPAIQPAPLAPDAIDSFDKAHASLLARTNVEAMRREAIDIPRVFTLERMRALARALGDPHTSFRTVHVAGSKGKGSVCEMTAAALRGCGFAVGLYTSPHLVDVRERIRIGPRMISPEEFTVLTRRVLEAAATLPRKLGEPTYFECLTALALLHFSEQAVDIAVIEVGLGGLLDATNIVTPDVTAVTSIHLEHTDILGETLEKIASHKAGIFKDGVPALTAVQDDAALQVLRAAAETAGARLRVLGQDDLVYAESFSSRHDLGPHFKVSLATPSCNFEHVPVPLKGEPQARNCALVLAIVDSLRQKGMNLPDAQVCEGLARTPNLGRLELIYREPRIVIDGAHTKESVQALVKAVGQQMRYDSLVVIFGCNADKDLHGMLGAMSMGADKIIFTRNADNDRAVEPRDLQRRFADICGKQAQTAPSVRDAINMAAKAVGQGDMILVTGSFSIAGEAKRLLDEKTRASRK
ncbi:MAG: folylpolyglutamate synthase/dihydrofolate synthase family protein [Phycisphaerales bacterium]